GRGLVMRVAEAAVAAPGQYDTLPGPGKIGYQRLDVVLENLRADRNLEHDVGGGRAGAILAHAVLAVAGLEVLLVAIVDQRVEIADRFDPHTAAAAPIAAIGAAEFDEFLAAESHAARSAVAGFHVDFRLVEKLHGFRSSQKSR